jgi:hypothetical protein
LVGTAWRKANKPRADKSTNVRTAASAPVEARLIDLNETPAEAAERIVRESGVTMSLLTAETLKENYLARLRQLEYDVKSGAVVPIAQVAKEVGAQFAVIRTRILSIPSERAPQVHRLKTVTEVQALLLEMLSEALEGLTCDNVDPA